MSRWERVAQATEFLKQQYGQQKWLVIVSDLQRREFSQAVGDVPDGRLIVIDLHPEEQNVAGITQVAIADQQPQPGIISQAVVEVSGRASGVPRPVMLSIAKVNATPGPTEPGPKPPPQMAVFDAGGSCASAFR